MARSLGRDQSIKQKNDASSIGNNRGMARRAKRHSNKVDRQRLKRQLECVVELTEQEKEMEGYDDYYIGNLNLNI